MTEKRAIQILKMNEQEKWRSGITAEEEKEAFDMAIEALKERPHGEWIDDDINSNEKYHFFKCSVCGGDGVPRCNFCPNCGADMRKEGDER